MGIKTSRRRRRPAVGAAKAGRRQMAGDGGWLAQRSSGRGATSLALKQSR